jgi:hypothetical protein
MCDQYESQPAAPNDIGLAGCGNFDALRRLRNHWLQLAEGEASHPLVPKEDAQPQLELLAEMAATAVGEPQDVIALMVAYHIRMETLQRDVEASHALAEQAVTAGNPAEAERWAATGVDVGERLAYYRAKVSSLVLHILNADSAEGSAMFVQALSLQADRGDERALPHIQLIMDSVSPERARAIQSEFRKLETAEVQ